MFKKIELTPTDGRKSFYNKCYAVKVGDTYELYSYDYKITTLNPYTKEEHKTNYYNFSRTTKRHQKAFYSFIENITGVAIQ